MDKIRFESYNTSPDGLPLSLQSIERTPYNLSQEQNWHKNLEIQLCTSGCGDVLVDGKIYHIEKGDIVVVNSNLLHYTFTSCRLTYTCLIISTKWCEQMSIPYDSICFGTFIQSKRLVSYISELTEILSSHENALQLAKTNKLLLEILIELVENHATEKPFLKTGGTHFDIVKNTITLLQSNFNQKLTLDGIARSVHYDKYALCREFKKYTGHTIISHLNKYRTLKAIDLLSQGSSVSEAASLCGFENLSFFTKIFKRYTGKLPSQYKKVTDFG